MAGHDRQTLQRTGKVSVRCVLRFGAAWIAGGCVFLSGCQSGPTGGGGQTNYAELYSAGQFGEAQDAAAAVAKNTSGPEKERAQLIAGLAANARDRDFEAEPFLRPLLGSSDPSISGRAGAGMGLIAQRAGQHAKAIDLFTESAGKSEGAQAARAWLYAGDSYRSLGEDAKSREAYAKAVPLASSDAALLALIESRKTPPSVVVGPTIRSGSTPPGGTRTLGTSAAGSQGRFTLQVGAYSSRQRAQATADKLLQVTTGLGLGAPRVIDTRVKGKSVTVVQIGRFATQEAAETARRRVGSGAFVTQADD